MEEYKLIEEIFKSTEKNGFIKTVGDYFGVGTQVQLHFLKSVNKMDIEKLDLSVRSYNCLKRAGIHKIGQVIDAVQEDNLWSIRNLGKRSRSEIRVRVYDFAYANLPKQMQKEQVKNIYYLNKDRLK